MGKVIIGIHGRSNKPEKEKLESWWRESIIEGLKTNLGMQNPNFVFDMAYYNDIYYPQPLRDDQIDEVYEQAKAGALKRYQVGIWDRIRNVTQNWAGQAADEIEKNSRIFSKFARNVYENVMHDLGEYYKDDAIKQETQKRLQDLLVDYKSDDIMIIAHSMGSIVANDALREMGRRPPDQRIGISQLVTIGSPLGLTPVKSEILQQHNERVRTPTVVHSWNNFSDPDDYVCVDTHLSDDFSPNSRGVRVIDHLVSNDYPKNAHKAFGYLRTPEMSEHIANFI